MACVLRRRVGALKGGLRTPADTGSGSPRFIPARVDSRSKPAARPRWEGVAQPTSPGMCAFWGDLLGNTTAAGRPPQAGLDSQLG